MIPLYVVNISQGWLIHSWYAMRVSHSPRCITTLIASPLNARMEEQVYQLYGGKWLPAALVIVLTFTMFGSAVAGMVRIVVSDE